MTPPRAHGGGWLGSAQFLAMQKSTGKAFPRGAPSLTPTSSSQGKVWDPVTGRKGPEAPRAASVEDSPRPAASGVQVVTRSPGSRPSAAPLEAALLFAQHLPGLPQAWKAFLLLTPPTKGQGQRGAAAGSWSSHSPPPGCPASPQDCEAVGCWGSCSPSRSDAQSGPPTGRMGCALIGELQSQFLKLQGLQLTASPASPARLFLKKK